MENEALVSEKIKFYELCEIFEVIKKGTSSGKRQHFDKFLRKWENLSVKRNSDGTIETSTENSFYDALRLFVPSLDERSFGIKELRLNTIVCKALMIKPLECSSTIASDLIVERLVTKVSERFTVENPQSSIRKINDSLDRIRDSQQQNEELNTIFKTCSLLEIKWLFHIIIGDVEKMLGIPHSSTILFWYNKQADALVKSGNSLRNTCELLVNESEEEIMGNSLLGKSFRPMLLKRLEYNKACLPKVSIYLCFVNENFR